MPTQDALDREDEVLQLVCRSLSGGDRSVEVAERPDRLPPAERPFDVDALLSVESAGAVRVWAADVVSVPFSNRMAGAVADLERTLVPRLETLAGEAGNAITVACHPRLFDAHMSSKDRKRQLKADAEVIVQAVQKALDSREDHLPVPGDDLGLQVLLAKKPEFADGVRVHFMPFISGDEPDILKQLRRDLAPSVRAKLGGQLAKPRSAGYPTVLVLDQRGHDGTPIPTNFLPSPEAIRKVVEECAAEAPGVLDAAVLVDRDDAVHELVGQVGVPAHDAPPRGGPN